MSQPGTPPEFFQFAGGRRGEIRHAEDGTFWLLWWKTPSASLRIGVFANAGVARFCADGLTADADLDALHADSGRAVFDFTGGFGEAATRS